MECPDCKRQDVRTLFSMANRKLIQRLLCEELARRIQQDPALIRCIQIYVNERNSKRALATLRGGSLQHPADRVPPRTNRGGSVQLYFLILDISPSSLYFLQHAGRVSGGC